MNFPGKAAEVSPIENQIKAFLQTQGVAVSGVAGPERLDGPPSLDLDYTLPGGRSIISMVLPMNAAAIEDFLSKKSPAPHNLDQFRLYQQIQHAGYALAEFLKAKGFRARPVPPSADYRRHPYVFATLPSFSHRFGAIAAGTAGQAWSGNVMTREYGAAVVLGTVVTDAVLKSDPRPDPDHFIKTFCRRCRRCARVCPPGMFAADTPEYVLLNGKLHERARRRNIDLCNISCFGLHSLSQDRKWSNWGLHWIEEWIDNPPDPSRRLRLVADMLKKGLSTGDSTQRFFVLEKITRHPWNQKLLAQTPALAAFPEDEAERYLVLAEFMAKTGITGIESYPIPMVCGHCILVCGPTLEETKRRCKLLLGAGLVVPGPGGRMTRVDTFEEALALKRAYPLNVSRIRKLRDAAASLYLWHRHYFGFEPRSFIQGIRYQKKLKKTLLKNGPG
ncbi:MAG: hypothetical protein AB1724_13770 [Thermodesulfobacteriota bacterium]